MVRVAFFLGGTDFFKYFSIISVVAGTLKCFNLERTFCCRD